MLITNVRLEKRIKEKTLAVMFITNGRLEGKKKQGKNPQQTWPSVSASLL